MSNSLAIATTTVVLGDIVQSGLGGVAGAKVTTLRPDEKENGQPAPEVNVFLYQVGPSPSHRNADLPTRTPAGDLRRRPGVALELDYLISFYGDEALLEPQRLLGGAVTAIHARPRVTASSVAAVVDAAAGAQTSDPRHYLSTTDLGEQVERVSFTPLTLNLEELSKLWSTLFRVRYVLSVAYRASVVVIEAELTPRPALPVLAAGVYMVPIGRPLLERVEAADGPDRPIVAGATVVLRGQRLSGELVRVRVGGALAEPAPEAIGDTEVRIDLDSPPFAPGALRAGVHGAQVVHQLALGTPPEPHAGSESNVVPFVLRPVLTSASASVVDGEPPSVVVTVAAQPSIGPAQRVLLLLDSTTGEEAYSFRAPAREAEADPVEIPIPGVPAGTYLVRIQVDGAESLLEIETAPGPDQGRFVRPTVTVP